MACIALPLSMWIRLGDAIFSMWDARQMARVTVLFVLVAGPVFLSQKMYRGIWRYASLNDFLTITRSATLAVLIFLPILFLLTRLSGFPRSTVVITWFVLIALLAGPRFLYRMIKDRRVDAALLREGSRRVPVLLVGDGDGAELFIRATGRGGARYAPVGILSGSAGQVGRGIHGVEVLGTLDDLEAVVGKLKQRGKAPERLVLTDHNPDGAAVRRLLDQADALGVTLARLPRLTDLSGAVGDRLEVTPVAVEDLLGRPQTVLDRGAMRALIRGRRVLVTGAGGSIGSELARQIGDCEPAALTLLDSSEFALYTIDQEIEQRCPALLREAVIADVRDRGRIAEAISAAAPELVFHAAALKHVPLVEANPLEGALTNAIGTRIVADACLAHAVRLMVLISTDKAVNPSSFMGACKRAAEAYCQALDSDSREGATRFVTVRFGNVLGSTGSVVPLFQKQLAAGGPITVTHPEMTRYFMTVREAVELVLQACALGMENVAYRGRIFVLDMGEPVRILHLARQMIRLAGLRPEIDIPIVFTGLRPGEKLFEEIFHSAEPPQPTEMQGILAAQVRAQDPDVVGAALDALEAACRALRRDEALAVLRRLVPEYRAADAGQVSVK